ncbi:RICIN domain-containing protein [Parabacteroides faecis]|uniref:RICIN domain-containing protein n=1 Tax=Parabacteroides faecis TaxID=1217282 RepID=UPI00216444F2|nr:RICIN domain-containing protein [Parabacteroides faecis]MCS2892578.1 RICIN domain-containing protein [Parabacteroides faecis]UVQ48784.1 RICIN domain-containing protein [Parabacteroides faecis]
MKIAFFSLLALIIVVAVVFGPRIIKDIKKKQNYANTYAIQNIRTGKCIRPYNAGNEDGTNIISYDLNNWECITWQMIELDKNTYLLKNLYTQKTFEPSVSPESGVGLWQQTLGGSRLQYWEFIEQSGDTYLIRLKDTELYVTATSDKNNSDIILMPRQDSDSQQWRLIRQNPII